MALHFTKPERVDLRDHPNFTEKWVGERIVEDPTILGLGDVEVVGVEKSQPKAGRLDLLLQDEPLNRRYEVELMLGKTDPSHLVRCIEYWDIERRRYPAYDHVAVLVAEDVTSRFLNVMGLLAGSIPLIAIQLVALRVEDKIALHFVHVLDQVTLRSDDEYELGRERGPKKAATDREYWRARIGEEMLALCDQVRERLRVVTGLDHTLTYRRRIIDVEPSSGGDSVVWLVPGKSLVRIGAYVPTPEKWVREFEELGQVASLRRGNKAAVVSFRPDELRACQARIDALLREAYQEDSAE